MEKTKAEGTCYSCAEEQTLYVSHSIWLVMSRINYSAELFSSHARGSRAVYMYFRTCFVRRAKEKRVIEVEQRVSVSKMSILRRFTC